MSSSFPSKSWASDLISDRSLRMIRIMMLFLVCTVLQNKLNCFAQNNVSPALVRARAEMPIAFKNEKACKNLYDYLAPMSPTSAVLKGYSGAVMIAMSRHVPIVDKLGYLDSGKHRLDSAVNELPESTELHFLRMTIQLNLPGFLGYSSNVESDKRFVFEHFIDSPSELKKRIRDFVTKSEHFTKEEKNRINTH